MRAYARFFAGSLALMMALSPCAEAGPRPHLVDQTALLRAASQHAAEVEANRAAIHEAMAHPAVRQIGERLGIDAGRLDRSIDTLDERDLAVLARRAREVNQAMIGGASTVTLSTTTIIIGLLVLILIIVAVK